jgi:hypothetical protein
MADNTDNSIKNPNGNPAVNAPGTNDLPAHIYGEMHTPDGPIGKHIREMPQVYPGEIGFQEDTQFTPISVRNFRDYTILGRDMDCTYAVDPQCTTGFVLSNVDIASKPSLGMVPAMHVVLRESFLKPYKQACRLRIRYSFAMKGVATTWYLLFADKYGGIVSDFEHLGGGKAIWKSFVRTAFDRGLRISIVDTEKGTVFNQPLSAKRIKANQRSGSAPPARRIRGGLRIIPAS